MSEPAPLPPMPEFPAATHDDWMKRVEAVLKGAAFEKALVGRSSDGIAIEPLYARKRGGGPVIRAGGPSRWRVMQRADHPEEEAGARLALQDLQGGADGLVIVCAGSPTARGFGIAATDARSLDLALEGTLIESAPLRLETAPFDGRRVAALIDELVVRRNLRPEEIEIDFGLDPVGDLARTGALPAPWPATAERFSGEVARLRKRGYRGTQARIDGRAWHEAGASQAQELAAMLATGVAYLRALEAQGMALDEARASLSFLAVADADEFLTVAKLRALRLLWARVEQACGLAPRPIVLQAETAWRMLGRRDPWVNLLRNTMAVFSSVIGGADSVTVLPFTAALGLPDAFACRLARNTQTVLMEESNLWRVADPAAGAGGFEALTEALCQKAWELFQATEAEGGIVDSLLAGALQERIATVAAKDERAIATRRAPLTGTSEFPHLAEAPVTVLLPAPAEVAPAPLALPSRRRPEPFERLRDASDAYLARHGQRPRAFLATLGSLPEFSARAGFVRNLLEAGGIEPVGGESAIALSDLADAFTKAGTPLACLCGPDARYTNEGAAAIAALKATGAHVVLAGRPGDLEAPLRDAGLAGALYAGCDAVATLAELHHVLGVLHESGST